MSAPLQEYTGHAQIPPNTLNSAQSSFSQFGVDDFFFAIFIVNSPVASGKRIKLHVNKYLEIDKGPNGLRSRTKSYSYNITWKFKHPKTNGLRLVRFDNQDEHYDYNTNNHFHCNVEFYGGKKERSDLAPLPAHIGENFPHVSEIFDFCYGLLIGDADQTQYVAAKKLLDIPKAEKADPLIWIPKTGKMANHLRFLLSSTS